ncbi:unnamed protein product [Arabis nemorensis]|uniref:Uncharacterized protein n=1 Tax=Arabis nemorensis TaxID=586526 RepID=A0A565CQN8_9BRAS|nr:unnamed protein product [Arabis nemorensis]
MKFLLELVVPCFGSQQQFHHQTADDSISNETQSLMKQPRRRKRVRVSGQPGHVAEWRPSLGVISEHKPAITEGTEKEEGRKVRRKSEGGGGSEASSPYGGGHVRFRSDDFG